MPIVCLNLFEKDMQIQCYSSSSDGVIAEIDIKVFPELHLNVNNLLGKPEGSDNANFLIFQSRLYCFCRKDVFCKCSYNPISKL